MYFAVLTARRGGAGDVTSYYDLIIETSNDNFLFGCAVITLQNLRKYRIFLKIGDFRRFRRGQCRRGGGGGDFALDYENIAQNRLACKKSAL